jgi:hypothetical protein
MTNDMNSLCVCAVMRVVYIVRIYYYTYDMTWESLPLLMWFTIEAHVAVICASAPALKVFFKETWGMTLGYRRSGEEDPENSGPSEKKNGSTLKKMEGEVCICLPIISINSPRIYANHDFVPGRIGSARVNWTKAIIAHRAPRPPSG